VSTPAATACALAGADSDLAAFVRRHPRLVVLTGAGCSVASGIPEYRDRDGSWKSRPPVRYAEFVASQQVRRRYWSRSVAGWERVSSARPGAAHHALAYLEQGGYVEAVVTQNVDGLHEKAGSRRVIDLHGRLEDVECLGCGARVSRSDVQKLLVAWNRAFLALLALEGRAPRPDGDAHVDADPSGFRVPDCPACGGVLKPAVVFFGENVPPARVGAAMRALVDADGLLVVGSSLMVFSGYRFCLAAREMGKPIAAVNLGTTRADGLLSVKVVADCGATLAALAEGLAASPAGPRATGIR
jgi:NAD-dependent SIR2 family protein deacetylase